ncbi:hypothetical protein BDF14DRAFT_1832415 [Spinellus fusiger]|nr:hypothetical protein BDF14DRAFT_1832415 [Spinellus fusiger]
MSSPIASTSTGDIVDKGIHKSKINNTAAPKTIVLAKKECPYCDKSYTTFQSARSHIYRVHGKVMERRTKSDHGNAVHIYNKTSIEKYNKMCIRTIKKFACISCSNVLDTKSELASHTDSTHVINNQGVEQLLANGHWIVQGEDISLKFHQYRSLCIKNSISVTVAIDSHFNELLSMSGILVLQKRYNYQSLPADLFPPKLLKAIHSKIISKYRRDTFNPQIFSQLKKVIQQFIDEEIEETRAKIELLTLSEEAAEDEYGIINAIVALLSHMYDCDMRPLSEAHLAASYIYPFLHGLLSSKTPIRVAHCSYIMAENINSTNNRPDYKVDIYGQGYQYHYTHPYGEIINL